MRPEHAAHPREVLDRGHHTMFSMSQDELAGVSRDSGCVGREASAAGADGQVGRVQQVQDRRQVHVDSDVCQDLGRHACGSMREREVVALAHVLRRRCRREAVLLLEAVIEAALRVDGDEDRDLVGFMKRSHEVVQLVAGLDIPGATGLGVDIE